MRKSIAMLLAAPMVLTSFASPTSVEARDGTMSPFVKSEHYLGNGSTQITLEQIANDPERYLRSGAYPALRQHIAIQADDDSLRNDSDFRAFLNSNKVKIVPCEGDVVTGGIRSNGTVGKLFRSCYKGEQRVLVQNKNGNWKPGLLLGCGNPEFTSLVIAPEAVAAPYRPAPPLPVKRVGRAATMTMSPGASQQGSVQPVGVILFDGGGHITSIRNGSASSATARSRSNSGSGTPGCCNPGGQPGHITGE